VRLLFIVPWGERLGGGEVMLQTLLDAARGGEHEMELAFLRDGPWPAELRDAGWRVEVIPAGRLRQPLHASRCILALSRLMRERSPDLVVGWIATAQLYAAPAAALAGMIDRLLWWQHEIATGHWIDRLATLLPARAVGCSSRAAADAQERLRPRRRTLVVAPGSPPPSQPGDAPAKRSSGAPPVVGMVGRLQPWKGQDRLLRAQAMLHDRGLQVRTLIVGGDAHGLSSGYATGLPRLVAELGLEGMVTLTGQVLDPGPYIEQMDVLVNASDPEPFGLVLLEAMARSVPVVAVSSGGPLEIVEDGRTGVLASSGQPAALADALQRLLASPELREQMGRAGRERYLAEFTDIAMRERFFTAMAGLVSGA
jgi:glycosyltransferase involved in cell wall biosynthesis